MSPTTSAGSTSLVGALYVALSAASFGALPIFIKIAYASGAEPVAVLALRFTFAALLMSAIMLVKGLRWPRGRNLLTLACMGALGYVGQSFCFFSALNYASAGLVSLLLYLYPALVTVLAAIFLRPAPESTADRGGGGGPGGHGPDHRRRCHRQPAGRPARHRRGPDLFDLYYWSGAG